ncbi:hypothetical protein DBR13_04685 [Aeromonas sp. HMWF015]|nr:hypothetical protein DBR13_04685 [Aeromonas sp. HMWF015]
MILEKSFCLLIKLRIKIRERSQYMAGKHSFLLPIHSINILLLYHMSILVNGEMLLDMRFRVHQTKL